MLQKQRLSDDGADATGAHKPGKGSDQLNCEQKQIAHSEWKPPGSLFSARLLAQRESRYYLGIRTPQALPDLYFGRPRSDFGSLTQSASALVKIMRYF